MSGSAGLHDAPIFLIADNEQYRVNPALQKHHKLARSLLSAGFAKELKPDAEERRRLAALVERPPTHRLREEVGRQRGWRGLGRLGGLGSILCNLQSASNKPRWL